MSSKRRIRRRSCQGKIRHTDQPSANQHATFLRQQARARLGMKVWYQGYKCRFCGGWHVGRTK